MIGNRPLVSTHSAGRPRCRADGPSAHQAPECRASSRQAMSQSGIMALHSLTPRKAVRPAPPDRPGRGFGADLRRCLDQAYRLHEVVRSLATSASACYDNFFPMLGRMICWGHVIVWGEETVRKELMVEALCWETQSKIHVSYAKNDRRLSCFCPDERCLARVYPKTVKNTYFYAENGHITGCSNEAESHADPLQPGKPKPKPSEVPQQPIPNWLGEPPRPQRRLPPSKEQLIALARSAKAAPPLYTGTMAEIVDAWLAMPDTEQAAHPLTVNGRQLNYQSAFSYLRYLQNDINRLHCDDYIIYGDAEVSRGKSCYFLSSIKRFAFNGVSLPLRLDAPIRKPWPSDVTDYVGQRVVFFWHGDLPAINAKQTAYQLTQPDDTRCRGLIIRPDRSL